MNIKFTTQNKLLKFTMALFFTIVSIATFAQSPGGVSTNLQLWLKANDGWSSTNWLDKSPNGFTAAKTGAPTQTSFINFNPTITMNGASNYYTIAHNSKLNQSAANKITVITVATTDKGGYSTVVRKLASSSWNDGWGMTIDNSTYTMGFNTGDWSGSKPSNAAYQDYTANVPNIFTGYSTAATGKSNFMAVNGATATASTGNILTGTNSSPVYLSYGDGSTFTGNIAEVIMYNDDISGERAKIETYLAVKYGIHKIGDYVDSSGNIVWNATANAAYHHNVAGIGRDNSSALNQHQSRSNNSGTQVLITTSGTFSDTNATASDNLHNGEYVIWGDNGQPKSYTTPLVHNAPGGDVNYRFGAIWKLQITGGQQYVTVAWPSGSTNFHLIRSTDDTFDTTDEFIPMSGTQTVNGVTYKTATFLAQDGDYFTFAGKGFFPGGVPNSLQLWMRSDKDVTATGANITSWKDQSVNGFTFPATGAPTNSTFVNFNPVVKATVGSYFRLPTSAPNFSALDVNLAAAQTELFASTYNLESSTSYYALVGKNNGGVWDGLNLNGYQTSSGSNQYLYGYSVTNWAGSGSGDSAQKTVNQNGNGMNILNGNNTLTGTSNTNRLSVNGGAYILDNEDFENPNPYDFTIGNNSASGSQYGYNGLIGDVIYYNTNLTSDEVRRVNTYLAIKNGVTIAGNYVNSAAATIWNASTNTTYNNNIFGVSRDDSSLLNQKVSKSTNTNTILTVATTNDFTSSNLDASRTDLATNEQALVFGDNNVTTTSTSVLSPVDCPSLSNGEVRIARSWMSQNTNDTGALYLQVDMSAFPITSGVFLLVGDSVDGTGKITGNTYTIPGTISGGKAVFNAVLPGVKYFTVGGLITPGVCTSCVGKTQTLYHWKGWNTWAKIAANDTGNFTIGSDANGPITARTVVNYAVPSMEISPSYYPSYQGSGTWIGRSDVLNGNAGLVTYTTTMSKAAKPTFILEGVSKYANSVEQAVIKGYCGTELVSPIITPYYQGANNQSYIISGNTVTGKNWYGYNGYSDVNVTFNRPVDKIVIEWTVNRPANPTKYRAWLYMYNYKLACEAPVEPNKDNVNITEFFTDDTQPACNDNTLNFKIENKNCDSRTINLTNDLPLGLEYELGSYAGIGTETPAISAQSFSLSNFVIPSGTSNISVKVKTSNPNMATTTFETQGTYMVTAASGGTATDILTDSASGEVSLQKTQLEVTAATPEPMPNINVTSVGDMSACGNTINYTVNIDNTNINQNVANLVFQTLLERGQNIVAGSVALSSGLSGTVPTSSEYEGGLLIPDLAVNSIANNHTITFQTTVTEIKLDPINEVSIQKDPFVSQCSISSLRKAKVGGCPTCEGGKGNFDMNYAWWNAGSAARTANEITNVAVGSPTSGNLFADAKVTYPTGVEWLPNSFPRWYGSWTEMTRYDNKNGAAGLVTYEVKLKDASGNPISAKPSFQVSGMGKVSGQTDIVSVKGYCGTTEVLPKLLYAYNSTAANNTYWRRFSIDAATATATGVKPYYDTYTIDNMNVEFEKEVDRVVVEWSVNRTPIRKTLGYLYVSDMKFVCKNIPEPNADELYITASTQEASKPTCDETTIKLNIQNLNCDAKNITLANTLPIGLEYVADSYVGLGTETPTYSGQNFSLSSLSVPSGNSYVYVNVKSTNNTTATYNTLFNYTVIGGTNSPNPYRSDDDSGVSGFQDLTINYTASSIIQKPIVTNVVDRCFKTTPDGNGTELTYTVTVQNPNATAISNVEFNDTFETNQTMVSGSVTYSGFTVNGTDESDTTFINLSGMEIAGNTTATITFKVMTNDTTSDIINMIKVNVDPSTECGSVNSVYSNELAVKYCTFCTANPNTTAASDFTKVGITTQAIKQTGWPENIPNGFIVLESKSKGFVITRVNLTTNPIPATELKEGMIVFDTSEGSDGCVKVYNGTAWKCIERSCNQ